MGTGKARLSCVIITAWKRCYPISLILEKSMGLWILNECDWQWCHPVQQVGPFTEAVSNTQNTCMSVAPAAVLPVLREARKWVNHSKRWRVYLIWWLKSVWMTANLLVGWSLELSNYGSYHCPVARCWGLVCIQLRAVDWCCVHISHAFGSCSNLTAIMVSDRTCHSKASS